MKRNVFVVLVVFFAVCLSGCTVQVGKNPVSASPPSAGQKAVVPVPGKSEPGGPSGPARLDSVVCNPIPPVRPLRLSLLEGINIPARCVLQEKNYSSSKQTTRLRKVGNRWELLSSANGSPSRVIAQVVLGSSGRVSERKDFNTDGTLKVWHKVQRDASGRLVQHDETLYARGAMATRKLLLQKWDGGRLVERRLEDKRGITTNALQTTVTLQKWTYNKRGFLLTATLKETSEGTTDLWESTWTYEREELPTSMTIRHNGDVRSRERWEWSKDQKPVLQKRDVLYNAGPSVSLAMLFAFPGINAPRQPGSTCRPLERGWGSGYRESVYTLGRQKNGTQSSFLVSSAGREPYSDYMNTRAGSRVVGLQSVYGQFYPTFGMYIRTPDLKLYYSPYLDSFRENHKASLPGYGHYGFEEPKPLFVDFGRGREGFFMVVEYDAKGRMWKESAWRVAPESGENVETSQEKRLFLRQRSWEQDKLREDSLTLFSKGKRTDQRTLRFQQDEKGALQRRELLQNGRVTEYQVWQRDASGRPTLVSFAQRSGRQGSSTNPVDPTVQATVSLRYDDRGRLSQETLSWVGDSRNPRRSQRTMTYTADGSKEEFSYDDGSRTSRKVVVRDSAGRVLENKRDINGDGTWERRTETRYNANGALLKETSFLGNQGRESTSSSAVYQWQCQ